MKKLLGLLFILPFIVASCNDDETPEEKAPECSITAPATGTIHDIAEDLVITGTGSTQTGTIASVKLTVGTRVITEVTAVPFQYTVPAADLTEGQLKIALEVANSGGKSAGDEVTITVQDNEKAPTARITAPADGSVHDVLQPLRITGEGTAETGTITNVKLEINGEKVPGVTTLPVDYTIPAAELEEGQLVIFLEVETDQGRVGRDEVTITVSDLNQAPVCSITSPADGDEFDTDATVVIRGTGSDPDGTISKVTLTVRGSVVSSVTSVPFDYTIPEADMESGSIRIILEVEDDKGKTARDEITITILGAFRTFTDPRDGKEYKTVKLGTQEWFAENLAYLPEVYPGDIGSEMEEYTEQPMFYVWGYYGTDVEEAKARIEYQESGVLYNWYAALMGAEPMETDDGMAVPSGIQGPCPDGWHVPSRGEWWVFQQWCYSQIPDDESVNYYDNSGTPFNTNEYRDIKNILYRLKARGAGWAISKLWTDEFPGSDNLPTDEWGWSAYPSGHRYKEAQYGTNFYYYANDYQTNLSFWTPEYRYYWYQGNPTGGGGGHISTGSKYEFSYANGGSEVSRGYSLRCVKD